MKQRHHEQYLEQFPDEEKTKWKDKNTYIGVRFEDTLETIIENTKNLVIEDWFFINRIIYIINRIMKH